MRIIKNIEQNFFDKKKFYEQLIKNSTLSNSIKTNILNENLKPKNK